MNHRVVYDPVSGAASVGICAHYSGGVGSSRKVSATWSAPWGSRTTAMATSANALGKMRQWSRIDSPAN
jgi:hypothetical protein